MTGSVSFSPFDILQPGAEIPITLTVTIPEDAPDSAAFEIVMNTNEGYEARSRIRFSLRPAQPAPKIHPNEVNVGLNPGTSHTETVTLTNAGLGGMKSIRLAGPDILPWVTLAGLETNELAPGESTTFQIVISPPEDLQLGLYSDSIVATDGVAEAAMLLTVEVSSANRGSVSVVLSNDADQPVKDAEIRLVSREAFTVIYGGGQTSTYHNVYYGKSDELGISTIEDIPIGEYDYWISAPGHEGMQGTLTVMPQSDAQILELELVAVPLSYTWTVTPIVIEDTYEINLTLDYVVEIPKPQFVFLPPWVTLPHDLEGDLYDQITVVNPSLVELHDVSVTVVGAEGIIVSSSGRIGTMAPESSTVIGFHAEAGNYDYLDGNNTYFEVSGTYTRSDPVTLEPLEEESIIEGRIPLANPAPQRVSTTWEGETFEFFFLETSSEFVQFDLPGLPSDPEETSTEVVKFELEQTATIEREGFDARLELSNGMNRELVGLSITPRVTDENGEDVTDRFFIIPPDLKGIGTVDGSSSLGPLATMNGRWILIPGEGLGGAEEVGKPYGVKAVLSYYVDGQLKETQTEAVEITVHPQPQLYLHYYLPQSASADEPFRLGLLVENEGDGAARNLKIDSGRLKIVDNLSGLPIDFSIVGSSFGSAAGDMVQLVLGDVSPHSTAQGYWILTTSLDGHFDDFSAQLTHRSYKGVDVNPLIVEVTTEIIQHDYLFGDRQDPDGGFSLIDRDHDGFPDYMINLATGLRLPIIVPDSVTVTKQATETDRTLELQLPETAGYVCVILPDPLPDANLRSVLRYGQPDATLSSNNFWKADGNVYFVDELGYIDENGVQQAESGTYILDFRSALEVTAVDCVPVEFSIIYSGEVPGAILDGSQVNPPQGDSLLTTYELHEPIFYIGTPPTEGQKAAIGVTIKNTGIIPESGILDILVTTPEGTEENLGSMQISELRAYRSEQVILNWLPQLSGVHAITATVRTDSPENTRELIVYVNDMPFADGDADFFSEVSSPTTFDGTRSLDFDGFIRALYWDFGDGVWGGGMGPTHVYEHSGTYPVHVIVEDDFGAMSEDVMQVTISETRPDLVVEAIIVSPAQPQEGEPVSLTATVRNIGTSRVNAGSFYTGFYVDGIYTALEKVTEEMGPGEAQQVIFTWEAITGNHLFTIAADDMEDLVDEADEGNNKKTIALDPDQVYFPDLVVDGVALSVGEEDAITWGEPITISATLSNIGTAASGRFRVNFYIDGQYVDYTTVDTLSEQEGFNTAAAGIDWVPSAGEHTLEVRVDEPVNHVVELDETNNRHMDKIPSLNIVYSDLTVRDFRIWPQDGRVEYGHELIAYGTVKNDSEVNIPTPIQVALIANGQIAAEEEIHGLAPGAEERVRLTWIPEGGTYDLTFATDSSGLIPETNETNNEETLEGLAVEILYPDLVVSDISIIGDLRLGQDVVVAVRLENTGTGYTGQPFNIRLLVNDQLLTAERMNQNLLAGTYDYWFVDWHVQSADTTQCAIAAIVDANEEIIELDETNNTLSEAFDIQDSYVAVLQTADPLYLISDPIHLTLTVEDSFSGEPLGPTDGITQVLWIYDSSDARVRQETFSYQEPLKLFSLSLAAGSLSADTYRAVAHIEGPLQEQEVSIAFVVAEDFLISVTTDLPAYTVGSPVTISGIVQKTDGAPIADAAVDLCISHSGIERGVQTETLADGTYEYTFTPFASEGGEYRVEVEATVGGLVRQSSAQFTIEGIVIEPHVLDIDMPAHSSEEASFAVTNVGTGDVKILSVSVLPQAAYSEIKTDIDVSQVAETLSSQESRQLSLTFQVGDFVGEAQFTLTVTFDTVPPGNDPDGYEATASVKLICQPAEPILEIQPSAIDVGIMPGFSVDTAITLVNTGYTGLTSLSLTDPVLPWIQLIRSSQTSLAREESTTAIVRINPPDQMETGVYSDYIIISHDQGQAILPITVEVTELAVADLAFHVLNDMGFTLYDAEIVLWLQESKYAESVGDSIVERSQNLTGVGDENGQVMFDAILAGTYTYEVSAPYHDGLIGTIVVEPGVSQDKDISLQFRPLELTLTQQISTDPITLGQAQLGVVLEPSSQATLLTDRPGAEYLLLRSGRMLIDRLAYLDLSANRKFQENLQFSLNNLTSTDIADVIISVDGDISDYIDISTNYVEKVPANGSVIVSYSIKLANLNTTEDHIVDGQLIIATWEEGHRVGFPIRIRVAEIENLHNNEPYHYIPYSDPWPTGPIMYGEDFINTWFKEANLVGGRAAGHSLGSVRLSQDVIIEGEAFTLAASLANLLPDKHIRIAATDLVITTTEGTHVTELFEVTETTSLSSDLAPSDQAYGSWRIAPQSDQHLGGTVADGIEYYITVEITYEIEGRAGKTLLPPLSITVKPVPSFAIRYHVETEIGSSANQVRIDLHVTNTGPGTASRLEIGFPQLHFATALYEVVNPEPMVFIEIGPDESVSGSWWLNFMVPTVDIAAIVSSLESATAEVTGGLSDIRIEAPVDFEFVTSTDIADLEQAVSDLLQASRDKFKAEQVVLAKFFSDLHSIARDSQDLIVAELQVHLWQFILKSSVSMLDIWSAMTGLREPFKPGMDLLETLERAGDFFEYTQALATLPFDMFELMYHALLSYQRYDELQESFDKLNSLIGKPDTTLNDFLNYVSEDIPYYRLNPHVLMVEFENLPQEPSQEEVLDMLAKAITSGAEGISGNELLEELDRLSNDTINLLSLVKETAIFPVDLLHAEITRLTQIIETVGTGYGVEQEKRETLPAYWYSVGEKGAWYPVSLQNWGFGIMYEDYINVLKAKGLLYSNFALHWEVIASALESNIWFGAYSALGTLMPAPFVGTSWQMAVGEVWDHVASLYDSAFQSLRSTELMIYDWLSELVRSLELHHQYESAGLWQMFSDFENHIAYILEHNPIDPDVSVRVESTNFSDIRVGEGNFIGADQAEIVVTNDCDLSLQIKPLVRIGAGGNTLGTFEGTPLTLAPGETGTSGVILVLPRSILYGTAGTMPRSFSMPGIR